MDTYVYIHKYMYLYIYTYTQICIYLKVIDGEVLALEGRESRHFQNTSSSLAAQVRGCCVFLTLIISLLSMLYTNT